MSLIATPIGAEGTSVSFNGNHVYMSVYEGKKFLSFGFSVGQNHRKQGKNPSTID